MRRPYIRLLVAAIGLVLAVTVMVGATGTTRGGKVRFWTFGPGFSAMSGTNEIGTDGKRRAGDLDGVSSFAAVIDKGTNQLCFGLTVRDIGNPTAAHIHKGNSRKNGSIVITLTAPPTGDPGAASGCVRVDPKLLGDIRKYPQRYYANVHTNDFPGGAVRGQLFHALRKQAPLAGK